MSMFRGLVRYPRRASLSRSLQIDRLEERVLLSVTPTVARQWDEEILDAIRIDTPRPPVHARNLFHMSVAMYDAWAAFDPTAVGYLHHEKVSAVDVEAARDEAISFAAYRILESRYAISAGAATSLASFDAKMDELGYDRHNTTLVGNTAAALGNRIAATVLTYGLSDGSLESQNYAYPAYQPVNPPLVFKLPGTTLNDPNRFQPLAFDHLVLQNGIVVGTATQTFVGPHWGQVKPFGIDKEDPDDNLPFDPGPPPLLGTETDAQFKAEAVEVIRYASMLDPSDSTTVDISPGALWNNTLGTNDGTGYPANPFTGLPYESNIVKRADMGRVLAEFWADGPHSETPPGHWNVLANYVSDQPGLVKQIGGTGPVLDDLEWDVKLYLTLNGAVHDAAIGAWGAKGYYDSSRPISQIRYMGGLGQSSDPEGPSYHPDGLPLEAGLVEVITAETTAPGQRHEHLAGHEGEIAILSWKGQPDNPQTEVGGVGWIRAVEWITYQRATFVTPPFAGYVSGHSTFSRAAAEVLTDFTGSAYFPGGLGTFTATANEYLHFEIGPSEDVVLQWATYYDAADQAGISRLWGGIHVAADDFNGRIMGSQIGNAAFARAIQYFNGQAVVVAPDTPLLEPVDFDLSSTSTLALSVTLTESGSGSTPLESQPGSSTSVSPGGLLSAGIDGQDIELPGGSLITLPTLGGAFAPDGGTAQGAWQLPPGSGGAAAFAAALRGVAFDIGSPGTRSADPGGNFSVAGLDVSFVPGSTFDFARLGTPGQVLLANVGPLVNQATGLGTLQQVAGQWVLTIPIDVTVELADIDGAGTSATLRVAGSVVATAPVVFTDVTATAGLGHVQHVGATSVNAPYFQPNLTGGAAAGDYNEDGYPDLLVMRLDAPPILYRNRGDGTFQDVSIASGIAGVQPTGSNGAGWVDVDNDGDLDLYITSSTAGRFFLYVNDGHGNFTEEAVARGAAVAGVDEHYGQSVAFGDYDNDGYVDLHVTEWRLDDGVQNPGDALSNSRLLHNRGGLAPGHFVDVTATAGVALDDVIGNHEPGTFATSSRLVDLDADGRLDLAVVGDYGETRLFWNNGDGTFSDGTLAALATLGERAFGSAVGDFNGDGLIDWFISGVYDPGTGRTGNRLYINQGNRTFVDATDVSGVREGGYGFGAEAVDYDNDGDLDLVLVGGSHFEDSILFGGGSVRLWRNDGTGVFTEVSTFSGFLATGEGRGLVTFDFDRDGDHDLFVVNHAGGAALYRNDGGNRNDWLRVDLRGDLTNRDGIGVTLEITPTLGGPTLTRSVVAGGGYLSQSLTEPLLGLGQLDAPLAQVVLRWPSGIVQTLTDVTRNRTLVATEPYDGPVFSDVTSAAGIDYLQSAELELAGAELQHSFTGGAAAGDYDRDGWVDLLVTRVDAPPILYRNMGDGTFDDVTSGTGLDLVQPTGSNGAGWADIDNDDDLDLYVTSFDDTRFYLYINDGAGHFTEEALLRDTALAGPDRHFGQSVSFGDYDRDGYLDIHVTEWRQDDALQNPTNALSNTRLLRNLGNAAPGHFVDVTAAAGVAIDDVAFPPELAGTWALSSQFADFDDDGWLDLAIVSDFRESRLFWNNGDGTFTDTTLLSGVGRDKTGMGAAIADLNGDGRLDWFVTTVSDPGVEQNHLYYNLGGRLFSDAPGSVGIDRLGWGWGTTAIDFDNDSDRDLVYTTGWHRRSEVANVDASPESPDPRWFEDPNGLLRNNGHGVFTDVAQVAGLTNTDLGKGLLTFDYDRDGDLDVFIVNHGSQPVLYQNQGNANHWLRVETIGTISNRDGIGARVTVTPVNGGPSYVAEVSAGSNFLAQNEAALHFGLGEFAGQIAEISIRWPSGIVQQFTNVNADSTLVAVESGVPTPPTVDSGGPYYVLPGQSVTLEATSTGNVEVYEWDLDNNGIYETLGASINYSPLFGGIRTIKLRVRGPDGSATTSTTIEVQQLAVSAGGPYIVNEGGSVLLSATATAGLLTSYDWDLDNDGSFETSGQTVSLDFDDNGEFFVHVRGTGPAGVVSSSTTIDILSVAPVVQVTGPASSHIGETQTFQFDALDASPDDTGVGFTYLIDWLGDGFFEQTVVGGGSLTLQHTFVGGGPAQVKVKAFDKDGAVSLVATHAIDLALAQIAPNPSQPGLVDLVWSGSAGNDVVSFEQLDATTVAVHVDRWNGAQVNLTDIISGISGGVWGDGASGNDQLDAQALTTLAATLQGGLHNDVLYGGAADDVLRGDPTNAGADGAEGQDVIQGNGGNDTIFGDGSEGASDTLAGGLGHDLIVADGGDGGEGNDVIYGDEGDDRIKYGNGNNLIDGGSGNDLLWSGIDGAEGVNQLDGGSGDDLIVGAGGADQILGRSGQDMLIGGGLNDVLDGGGGEDLLIGGNTSFDNDETALLALWSEWRSAVAYATRIAHLTGTQSGGLNGGYLLTPGTTVVDDDAIDIIFGGSDLDWFWYHSAQDMAFDYNSSNETRTNH